MSYLGVDVCAWGACMNGVVGLAECNFRMALHYVHTLYNSIENCTANHCMTMTVVISPCGSGK